MLFPIQKLIGMSISAIDGEIGKISDIYFDDDRWAVRYLVVETGGLLKRHKVLLSPIAVEGIEWNAHIVDVRLTREHVQASPDIDTDKPVSRQHEVDFLSYYGYPDYWSGLMLWGATPYPLMTLTPVMRGAPDGHVERGADPHLRSAKEVHDYGLEGTDGSIGHLEDFLVDDESWAIRYIVADTRNWWPGKHVVIPPQWIRQMDWANKIVSLDVTRDTVQRASEYDPDIDYSRAHEASLYLHSERPAYWT